MRTQVIRLGRLGATFLAVLTAFLNMPTANAASVTSAVFTGSAGTFVSSTTLYARNGGALTLTVSTSSDTRCVDVTGSHSGHQTSPTAKSSWTFSFVAGSGDGVKSVSASAAPNFNVQGNCTGPSGSGTASYILDNTPPSATASGAPAANNAGWNQGGVTVGIASSDGTGSGVKVTHSSLDGGATVDATSVPVSTEGTHSLVYWAEDNLGNQLALGSRPGLTIRIDKTNPTITGAPSPAANGFGWNNTDVAVLFTCSDAASGVKSCVADGTSPASASKMVTTSGANQSVSGTATDNADRTSSAVVGNINIDKVAPTITSSATVPGGPNGMPYTAGTWTNQNVTVDYACSDPLSGINSCSSSQVVNSEGAGQSATGTATDRAGNSGSGTFSNIDIDKTAPNTTTSAPSGWTNQGVTLTLSAGDNLSGVGATRYTVDGGTTQEGAIVTLSTEGDHAVSFWSVDNAGNTESAKTVHVKIDKTAPTISHQALPGPNGAGWNNTNVTVDFTCSDALSGVAACGPDRAVTTEGKDQTVTGTAADNAGNTSTDAATVSIDRTPPTISASADRPANAAGWYDDDVTVSFVCDDQLALSGIASCTDPKVLGEGANQDATGTASDEAGNSASATLGGIDVDETAPALDGSPTTGVNVHGWYNSDVAVHFTCSDALSGLAEPCPADETLTGEGSGLSATASVSDNAGNTATKTVSGIDIDRTAPNTSATVADPLASGWYAGPVDVTLSGSDGLSGVDTTFYSVDGGAVQTYSGAFSFSQKGVHNITYWSVDNAGNSEDHATGHSITIEIDGVPPIITGSRSPAPNAFGWNNTPVTVSFSCSDAESGVAGCDPGVTIPNEGQNQSYTGTASDNAGNTAQATVGGINVDTTPPSTSANVPDPLASGWYAGAVPVTLTTSSDLSGIDQIFYAIDGGGAQVYTGTFTEGLKGTHTVAFWSTDKAGNTEDGSALGNTITLKTDDVAPSISGSATPGPNANGWNKTDVAVTFSCSDAESGIESCTGDTTLTDEGQHSVTGNAQDVAGNTNQSTIGVNIDKTPPTLEGAPTSGPNAADWYRGDVMVHWTCDDNLSGLTGSCPADTTVTGEGSDLSATASVRDRAGNATSTTVDAIQIDRTAPSLSGGPTAQPNGTNGWYTKPVVVDFTCSDALSGVAFCPTSRALDHDSANASATSEAASDFAGNTTPGITVGPFKIDGTPPESAANNTCTKADNYCKGTSAIVNLTANDAMSGVSSIAYNVNGSGWQQASGAAASVTVPLDGSGEATVTYYAVDKAGNAEKSQSIELLYDNVAPTITHTLTPAPNAADWHHSDVTIAYKAKDDDTGSGVNAATWSVTPGGSSPLNSTDQINWTTSKLVTNETSGTVFTATLDDRAANTGTDSATIKLDKTPPSLDGTATAGPDGDNGWYREPVTVDFTCADSLSGIMSGTCPEDAVLSANGSGQSVSRSVKDRADNGASVTVGPFNIDGQAPSITGSASPAPNADNWNKSNVTVKFTCSDAVSGVASCPADTVLTSDGPNQSVSGTARDKAGNDSGSVTVSGINIDETAPTISGAPTSSPNANGWYSGPVTVHFTCGDATSGIKTCPNDVVLSQNGANQSVTGTAIDVAGNTKSVTVSGISIDAAGPTISLNGIRNGGVYVLGAVPGGSCSATDGLSGVTGACSLRATGGLANGVGTFSFVGSATDRAGNPTQVTGTYSVIYRWDGFLQPINDTAHEIGTSTSVFKAGSTVPAKLQLKKADGTVVQANSLPQWLSPARGSLTTVSVDESAYGDNPASGSSYRWDSTAQQYIYNWGTAKGQTSYYWRVGVTLDDGQTYYTNIGLR